MADTIKLLKGLKANLPSSGATPGAMYCCTDTGGIYIANSSGIPQLIANIDTGATSTDSSGSGNAVTSLSYNTSTRKLTYNLGNSFLPLAGGIITGKIDLTTVPNTDDGQKMGKTSGASGGIHFRKKGTNDEGNAITWSYTENDEAHAGIYVKSGSSYGTKMYLATTNLFNDGAKAALEIDHTGAIKALRSNFIGNLKGNADTATKFAAAQTVALSGDVTGNTSSQAGWSIATTLTNSGVTAGSYGPSANASPEHGKTFSVPYFTVDAKGRITAASTQIITLPTYTIGNATITIAAGSGLKTGGSFTTNQTSTGTITLDVNTGTGITITDNKVSLATINGLSAGSYGPSTAVTGNNNTTMSIPYITVDTYGRITNIENKTYTAKNTDTHYTTKLFATSSSGIAHAATTNGNTYLRLFDDSTARQSIKITGSGATTVSSDANGVITISSTDTKNAGTITAVQANGTNVATSGTANIPAASTSAYGVTKLTSATNSTSATLAATASAVKAAYDLANSKAPGYTYGTTDLTAEVSELATGTLYFVYE